MWGVGGTSPYLKLLGYPASPMACRWLSIATARQGPFYIGRALPGASSCTMDQSDTQAGSYTHWLLPPTGRFQHLHLMMMETDVHRHQGLCWAGSLAGWFLPRDQMTAERYYKRVRKQNRQPHLEGRWEISPRW